jgi:putative ABC transport system permease protein
MESLLRDMKHALRSMLRTWKFTAMIALCLALGIGANTAIFSVVNTILLQPLPFQAPDRLIYLADLHQGTGSELQELNASPLDYIAWRERSQSFVGLEATTPKDFNLIGAGEPERIRGSAMSAGLLPLLGVRPQLGRAFLPEEDQPGRDTVAILSHELWQRRFGGDRGVIGHTLNLDGVSYSVIGVMPQGFHLLQETDLWVPLAITPANKPRPLSHYLDVYARLKPGISRERAQSEMDRIAQILATETPDSNRGWTVRVKPLRDQFVGDVRRSVIALMAAVGFVLLIACANVANLLLTRSAELANQLALRSALGADRRRIVQQVLIESVFLSLLGALLGLFLASLSIRPLLALSPTNQQQIFRDVHIDLSVLGFTLLLAVVTGLGFGLVPALKASRSDLYKLLKDGGRRATDDIRGRRWQGLLVIAEMAVALVLLVCAGLMIKSFHRLQQVDAGFHTEHLLTFEISLPRSKYGDGPRRIAFFDQLMERIEHLPNVKQAGVTTGLPFDTNLALSMFTVEGRASAQPGEVLMANFRRISPGYLETLGVPLREGRLFNKLDTSNSQRVTVISEEMAKTYWPGQSPIGRRIQRIVSGPDVLWLTVVGVVGNISDTPAGTQGGSTFYIPYAQGAQPTADLAVRTAGEPMEAVKAIRGAVLAIDRDQPVDKIATMDQLMVKSVAKQRFGTVLLGFFAGLGLVLACIGIYGVISYSVVQRVPEIGIRMALGAGSREVLLLILGRGLMLTFSGVGVGLLLAFLLSRLISGLLYEVKPTDPTVFAMVPIALGLVAVLASYLPARRATRVNPIVSLKSS